MLNDRLEHTGPDTFTGTTDYQQIISIDTLPILRTHASTSTCMTHGLSSALTDLKHSGPSTHIINVNIARRLTRHVWGDLQCNETSRLQTIEFQTDRSTISRSASQHTRSVDHAPFTKSALCRWGSPSLKLPTMTPARTSVPPQLSDQSSQTSPLPMSYLDSSTPNNICGSIYAPARGAQQRRRCSSAYSSFLFFLLEPI